MANTHIPVPDAPSSIECLLAEEVQYLNHGVLINPRDEGIGYD